MSKSNRKKHIVVFTDGACSYNGKKNATGGIGIHFPNKELKDISRIFRVGLCTNQRTELYAILTAIRYIKKHFSLGKCSILIKTDSEYCINCVTKWAYGWVKNGWITKNGEPVANKEFIEIIHKYHDKYHIEFEHVDGHSAGKDKNSIGNNTADKLAVAARDKATIERKNNARRITNNTGSKSSRKTSQSRATRIVGNSNGIKQSGFPRDSNFIVELVKTTKH